MGGWEGGALHLYTSTKKPNMVHRLVKLRSSAGNSSLPKSRTTMRKGWITPEMINGGTWETMEVIFLINSTSVSCLGIWYLLPIGGLENFVCFYLEMTQLSGRWYKSQGPCLVTLQNLISCKRCFGLHKRNLFRTQCSVVCWHECDLLHLPPSIPCLHYSSNSRLRYVSKKVCTHSPSMFLWAFFFFLQWWACGEEGNKYIGPVNGNNNKIWLIKLK